MHVEANINTSLAIYRWIFSHSYSCTRDFKSLQEPGIANLFKKLQLLLPDASKPLGVLRMTYQTVLRDWDYQRSSK